MADNMEETMAEEQMEWDRVNALQTVMAAIFGRNNLITTDFAGIESKRVGPYLQNVRGGVHFEFTLSYRAIGKIDSKEFRDALDVLLDEVEPSS